MLKCHLLVKFYNKYCYKMKKFLAKFLKINNELLINKLKIVEFDKPENIHLLISFQPASERKSHLE